MKSFKGKHTIKITEEHIVRGIKANCGFCPALECNLL